MGVEAGAGPSHKKEELRSGFCGISNKSQENTDSPVLRLYIQGLVALEGVLVVSIQLPAEAKHHSHSCVPLQERGAGSS